MSAARSSSSAIKAQIMGGSYQSARITISNMLKTCANENMMQKKINSINNGIVDGIYGRLDGYRRFGESDSVKYELTENLLGRLKEDSSLFRYAIGSLEKIENSDGKADIDGILKEMKGEYHKNC